MREDVVAPSPPPRHAPVLDREALLAAIREATASGDGKALERAAHNLKGALGNFSVEAAVQAAGELWMMGRQRDLKSAGEALAGLEEELERLKRR